MTKSITYKEPETAKAGFSMNGPVLDVELDGELVGSIIQSWENRDRWNAQPVFWYQPRGRNPGNYSKTRSLAEQILQVQRKLLKAG